MSNPHTKFDWISSNGLGEDSVTDGRTDGGDCNIPDAFLKKRGDKYGTSEPWELNTQGAQQIYVYIALIMQIRWGMRCVEILWPSKRYFSYAWQFPQQEKVIKQAHMSQHMRFLFLRNRRAAKAQTSLHAGIVSPELSIGLQIRMLNKK